MKKDIIGLVLGIVLIILGVGSLIKPKAFITKKGNKMLWQSKQNYNIIKGDEWITRNQIGSFIFTRVNLLEIQYKEKILNLILDFLDLIKPDKVDLIRFGSNAKFYKNFTLVSLNQLKMDYKKFKYRYAPDKNIFDLGYEIDIKKGGGKNNTIGDYRLYIHIYGNINYDKNPYVRSRYTHEISFYVPPGFSKLSNLIELSKRYYTLFNCVYGYINPVISYNKVPLEASWEMQKFAKDKEIIFDIPDNHGNSEYFETRVKGVQWGNFISKTHIKQLGGKEKIKRELNGFIIEKIGKDSLFIRMPFDLPVDKNSQVISHYRMLARFFDTIFIQQWHDSTVSLAMIGEKRLGDIYLRRFLRGKWGFF